MKEHARLNRLFAYDRWASKKIADVINVQSLAAAEEAIRQFAHLPAAQQLWYNRITDSSTGNIKLWPRDVSVEEGIEKLNALHAQWINLLDENQNDLDREISYQHTKDSNFRASLSEILHHIIIHGQHHRAQISTLLRQHSIAPPATDFIFYLRETSNNQ